MSRDYFVALVEGFLLAHNPPHRIYEAFKAIIGGEDKPGDWIGGAPPYVPKIPEIVIPGRRKDWTQGDIKKLEKMYPLPHFSVVEIARDLSRTPDAIHQMAHQMGLHRKDRATTETPVAADVPDEPSF